MRKLVFLILVLGLLVVPSVAAAQSDLAFEEVMIQLWPEYDRPEMLVMYSLTFPAGTTLPAEAQIRVPVNASLNAVAKVSGDSMLTVPYDTPSREGDWMVIKLQIDELTTYRVEYYLPMEKDGATRQFTYLWESAHPVTMAFVQFLAPIGASNLVTSPEFSLASEEGGMQYYTLSAGSVPASEALEVNISYEKENDDLTVSSMPVEMGGGASETSEEPQSSFFSTDQPLPMILVAFGVLLIAGGLVYFFLSGRDKDAAGGTRKRHKASEAGTRYCHECGSRASGNDKFCRSCGAKLRK